MTFGLEHPAYSLPEVQARKWNFFVLWLDLQFALLSCNKLFLNHFTSGAIIEQFLYTWRKGSYTYNCIGIILNFSQRPLCKPTPVTKPGRIFFNSYLHAHLNVE